MSARTAWRLASKGFTVFEYAGGKSDWLAHGKPREGRLADAALAGSIDRRFRPPPRRTVLDNLPDQRAMAKKDPLKQYRDKRDFRGTREPRGGRARKRPRPRFVIQKHAARSLHYDFRIEADGVLKSWAVPKGPSTDPRDKRLAMPTEDHPLDYADFEGVIPRGHYGAGTVLVWDTGSYRNTTERDGTEIPVGKALADGHLTVWLEGRKLKGGYALTRIGKGKSERWLLVKEKDVEADARRNPIRTQPESVLSGHTIEQIADASG